MAGIIKVSVDFENPVFHYIRLARFVTRICDTLKQVPAVYKFIPIKLRPFAFDFVQLGIIRIFSEQFSTRLRTYTASGITLYEFFQETDSFADSQKKCVIFVLL